MGILSVREVSRDGSIVVWAPQAIKGEKRAKYEGITPVWGDASLPFSNRRASQDRTHWHPLGPFCYLRAKFGPGSVKNASGVILQSGIKSAYASEPSSAGLMLRPNSKRK
jgi:hypothetical protein